MSGSLLIGVNGVGTSRQERRQGLNEINTASSAATVERLENAIKDINSKLDQVFLSASLRCPSGLCNFC